MVYGGVKTALGDLLERQFKERKLRCEIETQDGLDPCLKFYVLPSDGENEEKSNAFAQLFCNMSGSLRSPGRPLPREKPDEKDRRETEYARRTLKHGITITDTGGWYESASKHYVMRVYFPAWQMEGAQRIQASFGRSIP